MESALLSRLESGDEGMFGIIGAFVIIIVAVTVFLSVRDKQHNPYLWEGNRVKDHGVGNPVRRRKGWSFNRSAGAALYSMKPKARFPDASIRRNTAEPRRAAGRRQDRVGDQ